MESNQLKTLQVDWLGHCPTCAREQHIVSKSEGNKDYLYEDDTVKCWCGQTGVIETDGHGHAWCNWDEKEVSEWDKFNIYYRQKYPEYWDLLPKANHQACSHHEELFNSWVAATAQAVPEGFVLVEASEFESLKSDNEHFTKSCIDWTDRAYKQRAKVDHIKNEVERFKQSGTNLDLSRFLDNLIEFSTFKHDKEFDGFVLVPRELSDEEARKHAEAMFNKVEHMARNEHRDLSESEFEAFKNRWIDARTLTIQFDWKAMIEAQEQSHV